MRFTGMAQLHAALHGMPARLRDEAEPIVETAARRTYAAARSTYEAHVWKGNLLRGLRMLKTSSATAIRWEVYNSAPHAWMVENGTVQRQTSQGWDRGIGPPMHALIAPARRHRATMQTALADMLRREGFLIR